MTIRFRGAGAVAPCLILTRRSSNTPAVRLTHPGTRPHSLVPTRMTAGREILLCLGDALSLEDGRGDETVTAVRQLVDGLFDASTSGRGTAASMTTTSTTTTHTTVFGQHLDRFHAEIDRLWLERRAGVLMPVNGDGDAQKVTDSVHAFVTFLRCFELLVPYLYHDPATLAVRLERGWFLYDALAMQRQDDVRDCEFMATEVPPPGTERTTSMTTAYSIAMRILSDALQRECDTTINEAVPPLLTRRLVEYVADNCTPDTVRGAITNVFLRASNSTSSSRATTNAQATTSSSATLTVMLRVAASVLKQLDSELGNNDSDMWRRNVIDLLIVNTTNDDDRRQCHGSTDDRKLDTDAAAEVVRMMTAVIAV